MVVTEPPVLDHPGAPDLSRLDQHLGDVVVEEEIARTPLAAVYRVRTGAHGDRSLALKVTLQPCDAEELARFRHEVRMLSEVRHPNVVEVFECGALPGGFPFLTMELLSPLSVAELVRREADGEWETLYDLAIQAAAGLAHIHRQGVIHHDLKPSNLGLAEGEGDAGPRLKILDFGLAQVVRRGLDSRIRGTLAYTAPEVILQDAYDQRADLYSLGLTLYELATGRLPSDGGRRAALAFHLGEERPDPRHERPDMPGPLAEVIRRLLARDPARRFPSAGRLLVELGKAAKRRIDPAELTLGGTLLSSRLVGRDGVMTRLRGELDAARQGRGRVVVVEGGEGLGKSRLLREFRIFAAVGGARVGFGAAGADRGRSLAPLLEALARLNVDVETPPPAAGEEEDRRQRHRLYRRIGDALRRELAVSAQDPEAGGAAGEVGERHPRVLLLDDLHLTGIDSGELLAFLAAEVAHLPVVVVATREGDAGAAAAEGSPVLHLGLTPFDREGTGEMVDACLGTSGLGPRVYDVIHRRSEGVPGAVLQVLRHLLAEGVLRFRNGGWKPSLTALERWVSAAATADDLDGQRLERLDAGARRMLDAAAVIDEPFRLAEVAALLGEDALSAYGRLSDLVEGGYLERLREAEGPVYVLPRRRLAVRLYEEIDAERRAAWHRRRAEDLRAASRRDGRDRAAAIAEHAWRAGERVEALPHLLQAARAAVQVYAHAEAARLYGRAVEAAVEAGRGITAVEAAAERAEALRASGAYGRARRLYDRLLNDEIDGAAAANADCAAGAADAADAPRPLDDPLFHARLLLRRGRVHKRLGDHGAALASYQAGLGELGAGGEQGGAGSPLEGDDGAVAELVVELMRAEASALFDLGRGDDAEERALQALRKAEQRSGEPGFERQRAQLLSFLGMLQYARGDWDEAGRLVRRALATAEAIGGGGGAAEEGRQEGLQEGLIVQLRQNLGNVLWKTGDYVAAHEAYGENLRLAEETRDLWGQLAALNNLGILEASRGEWRAAREFLGRALEMTRRLGVREQEAMARLNLGEVEEMLGAWGRARRHLERGLELLRDSPDHPTRHALLAQRASLARKQGGGAQAEGWAGEALAGAEANGDRDLAAQCQLLLGLVAKDREDFPAAAARLERAGTLADGAGTRQLLARVRISLADLELRRQDAAAARRAVEAARRLVDELPDRFAEAKLEAMEARLASLSGDEGTAGPLYVAATRTLEQLGTPYELGRSLYEWGVHTWNPELAEERLRRALGLFEELEAESEVRRTRGVLERIQEHGRRSAGRRDPVLYEVVKVINSTLDLSEVLDRTMDLVLEHLRAERGMVVLFDPLTRELETAVSRNLRHDGDEAGELSESVVRKVIDDGEPVVTVDAQVDQRFHGAESIVASNILSILCVPMQIRDRLAGAIYVDHTHSRGLFEDADVDFLVAFADQAAVAIEKARLYGEQEAARRRLKEENEALKREILSSHHLGSLIGKSRAIAELKNTLERVAQSDSTVLIRGESGTGKGLVARIIHNISGRREKPFVQFNCAALPETLVESELFGHEKGAFTGASGQKPGRFELADGGTIFLDEVGKVSRAVQAKLLRVVEDKRFERVGGTRTLDVDVRIVAATNLNLEEAISTGDFREDLYYRLAIIPIVLPPLRERRGDVPYLVQHFLREISRDLGQPQRELDPDVLELFEQHDWPGNVRELESAIHRALVLSSGERLTRADFSWIAVKNGDPGAAVAAAAAGAAVPRLADGGYQEALDRYDRRLIEAALEQCDGRIRETARMLDIARNTLKAKMDRYGIER